MNAVVVVRGLMVGGCGYLKIQVNLKLMLLLPFCEKSLARGERFILLHPSYDFVYADIIYIVYICMCVPFYVIIFSSVRSGLLWHAAGC